MAHILVMGASRGIGFETVRAALDAGHTVRAFSRRASAMALTHERLSKLDGDATRREDVERALAGVDAVVQVLGADHTAANILRGTDLFSRATRVLVEAMKRAGVTRLLSVTGLGAGDSRGHGGLLYDAVLFPLVLKRLYDDKDIQEQIVRHSGLEWTIARPGLLRDGPATGLARAITDKAQWRAGSVRRSDVALVLVQEVESGRFIRQTPLVIE